MIILVYLLYVNDVLLFSGPLKSMVSRWPGVIAISCENSSFWVFNRSCIRVDDRDGGGESASAGVGGPVAVVLA